jgi:hypothetical protein
VAITLRNPGTWDAVLANTQTVTLPTHSTGDMLLVRAGMKHATLPGDITCATNGWARVGQYNNGTTASSNGGGDVQVAVFWKVATSGAETNPVITFHASTNATPGCAVAMAYQLSAGEAWVTPVGAGGSISAATSYSATMGSHISATVGDLLDSFAVTNDNTTLTSPTVAQTGLTLDAVTESPAAALSSATSNDISADGCYRKATAGTSSAAAVASGTNSVADVGAAFVTRLRVEVRTDVSVPAAATATGAANNATTTVQVGGTGSAAATGAANAATLNVQPPAGVATATGTAYDATADTVDGDPPAPTAVDEVGRRVFGSSVLTDEVGSRVIGAAELGEAGRYVNVPPSGSDVDVDAGVATATGAAYNATTTVTPAAGHAAATGAANAATLNVQPSAGNAAATGQAYAATTTITPAAGHASATGTAQVATLNVQPNAGHAAATGAAYDATTTITAAAGNAAATGAALQPSLDIKATTGSAAATGQAYDATTSTASLTNVDAGVATATGEAHQPSVSIAASAGSAAATGAAHQPSASVAASAGNAAATGEAYGTSTDIKASAGSAAATGAAYDATTSTASFTNVDAGHASATGEAHDATISAVDGGTPPAAPPGGSHHPDNFPPRRRRLALPDPTDPEEAAETAVLVAVLRNRLRI